MKTRLSALRGFGSMGRPLAGAVFSRPWLLRAAGYALFFIAAFIVSLAWKLPPDAITAMAGRALEGSGLTLAASSAGFSLPLGIRMDDVTLYQPAPGKNVEIISARLVKAHAPLSSVLTLRRGLSARVETLGGAVELRATQKLFNRAVMEATVNVDGVNPGLLPALGEQGLVKFNGALDGEGYFSFEGSDMLKGAGRFKAHLSKPASLTLSKTLSGTLGDVAIESAEAEISYKSGALDIDKFIMKGPVISVAVTGSAQIAANPRFSRLNLKAEMSFHGELEEKLKPLLSLFPKGPDGATVIRITGTPAAPSFR